MKQKIVLLILLLILAGCIIPTPGATETPGPSPLPTTATPALTQETTVTPSPTDEDTPTVTPEATSTPEPTETPVPGYYDQFPNRLKNGEFDGTFALWPFDGGRVAPFWKSAYCNETFSPEPCPVPLPCEEGQTQGCNQPGDMITPEFKRATVLLDPFRVFSGEQAQAWHCVSANCWGGVWQAVETTPGEQCEVKVHTMTWGATDWHSNVNGDPYRSDHLTEDDRHNMTMQIVVHATGPLPPMPFSDDHVLKSKLFGYEDGIYDIDGGSWISYPFIAQSDTAFVFFLGANLWPTRYSEWYVDAASVRCDGVGLPDDPPETTPTPIVPEEVAGQGGGGVADAERSIDISSTSIQGEKKMFESFDFETLGTLVLFLVAIGYVVTKVIGILKRTGKIKPGAAADWNQAISALIAIAIGVLQQLGMADRLPGVEAGAEQWAALVVAILAITASTKLMHEVGKRLGITWKRPARDFPKAEIKNMPLG